MWLLSNSFPNAIPNFSWNLENRHNLLSNSPRENCPKPEFFLVRIFLFSEHGWNELISLINSWSGSWTRSQIKNISSIYLHKILRFFLTLLQIFSLKVAIKSIAYGGTNFVQIAVPRICLQVLPENSKMLFFNRSLASSIKVSFATSLSTLLSKKSFRKSRLLSCGWGIWIKTNNINSTENCPFPVLS